MILAIVLSANSSFVHYHLPQQSWGIQVGNWGFWGWNIKMGDFAQFLSIIIMQNPPFLCSPTQNPWFPTGVPQDYWGRGKGYKEAFITVLQVLVFRITSNAAIKYNSYLQLLEGLLVKIYQSVHSTSHRMSPRGHPCVVCKKTKPNNKHLRFHCFQKMHLGKVNFINRDKAIHQ